MVYSWCGKKKAWFIHGAERRKQTVRLEVTFINRSRVV